MVNNADNTMTCVASAPVQRATSCSWPRANWSEGKKSTKQGVVHGANEGTLARKLLNLENPVRP